MLPVNSGGHSAYQDFLLDQLRKYYPVPDFFSHSTWDIIDRFWNLDLSFTDEFMWDKYSVFGPKPRTPSCMQRSFLFSIDFKVTSLTDWAAQLKINPLYAILSGFEFGDTPGVGTFYDFLNRLWDSDSDNENTTFRIEEQPYGSLFQLYKNEFLDQSVSEGLITPENLALAGTPPEIPGITAMTYTCSSLPILKVICLFSRCSHLLLPMIPTGSCIAFSG